MMNKEFTDNHSTGNIYSLYLTNDTLRIKYFNDLDNSGLVDAFTHIVSAHKLNTINYVLWDLSEINYFSFNSFTSDLFSYFFNQFLFRNSNISHVYITKHNEVNLVLKNHIKSIATNQVKPKLFSTMNEFLVWKSSQLDNALD